MNFKTYSDLSDSIFRNLDKLPKDCDIVAGVPRSGMLAASIVSLYLNLPLTDVDSLLKGELYIPGATKVNRNWVHSVSEAKKILIVEDSVASGNSILAIKEKVSGHLDNYEVIYFAVYVRRDKKDLVDIYCEVCNPPRMFEWNVFHHNSLSSVCFDIDGVLCRDPTNDENDDGEKYIDFISNVPAKIVPTYPIGWIVTTRLEKYRPQTEAWLKKNGIEYGNLIMMQLATKEERQALGNHGIFKGEEYKKLKDASLFVESNRGQAEEISRIAGKGVFCTDTHEYFEDGKLTKTVLATKRKLSHLPPPITQISSKDISFIQEDEEIDIAFVILHYMAVEDTFECVESIKKYIDTDNYRIVVVDNNSPDGSLKQVREKYAEDLHIHVLHNEENLGYARGNNAGIDYIRRNYRPRFIAILNNDICLFQEGLYQNLCHAYDDCGFAVLGPMIITADGTCKSNPFDVAEMPRSRAERSLKKLKRKMWLSQYQLDRVFFGHTRALLGSIKRKIKKRFKTANCKLDKDFKDSYKIRENCPLHGSFLVFSSLYFDKFEGFDPRTFLYLEENILFVHMKRNNLKTLYYPAIAVFHKEDASTEESIGIGRKKMLFITNENIKSYQVYIDVLREYDGD